jgi:hypothetical protein
VFVVFQISLHEAESALQSTNGKLEEVTLVEARNQRRLAELESSNNDLQSQVLSANAASIDFYHNIQIVIWFKFLHQ